MKVSKKYRGIIALAGCFISNMVMPSKVSGTLNIWGIISLYFTSYFHSLDSSVTQSKMYLGLSVSYLFDSLTLILASYLCRKIGCKWVALLGAILAAFFLFLSSFMTEYYAFCLLYGLNAGIVSGMISMPAIWACWGFYPKRIGLVSSIGLAGKSTGSTVFGFLWAWLINPNNESLIKNNDKNDQYFASSVNNNVPGAIRWVSLAYFITAIFGTCMICNKKYEKSEKEEKVEDKATMKLIDVLKQKKFWLLTMMFYFFYIFYVYLLAEYKDFGTTKINDDLFFTIIGAIGFLLGGMSRLLCGYFLDKILWWKIALISASVQICISLTIFYIVGSEILYAIWVLISFIFVSCTGLVLVMACKVIYPHDNWVLSYSTTGFTLLIGSLYAYQLLIFPIIGYQGTFFVMAGSLFISIIVILFLKKCKCTEYDQDSDNPGTSPTEAKKVQAEESTESNSSAGANNNKLEQIITTEDTHKLINL